MLNLKRVISGGQTGADQGALDAAIDSDLQHGGAVPAGRKTESGRLPDRYRMEELPSEHYPDRTAKNVRDSDATLIISHGELTGGSALTRQFAHRYGRPCLHLDLDRQDLETAVGIVLHWLAGEGIRTLNVAGPRASSDPQIHAYTYRLISSVIERVRGGG
jgi:hypothetical protein